MDKKHKIFTHCTCGSNDTFTKKEISDDITNLLLYIRVLATTKETINNIERRKDTHDINSNVLKQRKRDIIKLNKLIDSIKDKYTEDSEDESDDK